MDVVHTSKSGRKSAEDRVRPGRIRREIRRDAALLGDGADVCALWARCRSFAEHRYVAAAWRRLTRRRYGPLHVWQRPPLPDVDLERGAPCLRCGLLLRLAGAWSACPVCGTLPGSMALSGDPEADRVRRWLEAARRTPEAPETEDDARKRAVLEGLKRGGAS